MKPSVMDDGSLVLTRHKLNADGLDRLNIPEADFAVLKYRADFYASAEPVVPYDVLLLIEVSDSSLRYDRGVKLPLYARSRIAETWIVDLKRHTLESYRLPEGDRFSVWSPHHPGETLSLHAAPDLTLTVTDLIGA